MKGAAHIKQFSREHDAVILDWLHKRTTGSSAYSIAKASGKTPGPVISATNNVIKADLAESGEPESVVRAGYWA